MRVIHIKMGGCAVEARGKAGGTALNAGKVSSRATSFSGGQRAGLLTIEINKYFEVSVGDH